MNYMEDEHRNLAITLTFLTAVAIYTAFITEEPVNPRTLAIITVVSVVLTATAWCTWWARRVASRFKAMNERIDELAVDVLVGNVTAQLPRVK